MAHGTNIGALGAGNRHSHPRQFHGFHGDIMDHHRSRLTFHGFTGSCQLIQPFSIHLQSRIHRRDLIVRADKAFDHLQHLLWIFFYWPFLQDLPADVLGVRVDTQKQYRPVHLTVICQHIAQSGSLPQTDRKNSLCVRVQGACMPDLFLS